MHSGSKYSLDLLPDSSICFLACALPTLGLVNSERGAKAENFLDVMACVTPAKGLHYTQIYSTSEPSKFYKVTIRKIKKCL